MSQLGYALCVNRNDVLTKPIHLWSYTLEDRDIVDDKTKLDPQCKQLLPYIIAYYLDEETNQIYVVTYLRKRGGGEKALHDLRSIGFGGHIDQLPNPHEDLMDFMARDAIREKLEETGIKFDLVRLRTALAQVIHHSNYLMIENRESVHSVHLGFPVLYPLNKDEFEELSVSKGEKNQVEDIRAESLEDLMAEHSQYELWSQLVLQQFIRRMMGERIDRMEYAAS
jgi:predicted NUDIX family phosphoesterase